MTQKKSIGCFDIKIIHWIIKSKVNKVANLNMGRANLNNKSEKLVTNTTAALKNKLKRSRICID